MYPQDITGVASTNLVGSPNLELYSVTPALGPNANYIIPDAAPFFGNSIKVYSIVGTTQTLLTEGVDYALILRYISASYSIGLPIYGGIAFLNSAFNGQIGLTYQTLGGNWGTPSVQTASQLINDLYNPMTVSWDQISGIPTIFPPQPHLNSAGDFTGFAQVITAITGVQQAIVTAASDPNNVQGQLAAHENSPTAHSPSQVGLGNVSNYPVATQQQAIQGIATNAYMTPFLTAQAINTIAAASATKLNTPLQINLTGAVTGSVSFNGSEGTLSLVTTLANTSSSSSSATVPYAANYTFEPVPIVQLQNGSTPLTVTALTVNGDITYTGKLSSVTSAVNTVTSGTTYTVSSLGTATLAQWQTVDNTLTAIPAVGQTISTTSSGSIPGGATVTPVTTVISKSIPLLSPYGNTPAKTGTIGDTPVSVFAKADTNDSVYFGFLLDGTFNTTKPINLRLSFANTQANGNVCLQLGYQIFASNAPLSPASYTNVTESIPMPATAEEHNSYLTVNATIPLAASNSNGWCNVVLSRLSTNPTDTSTGDWCLINVALEQ